MDNHKKWVDPPTVIGDTDRTDPFSEHIETHNHEGDQHRSNLKSNISTGYQLLHSMFYKVIYFMLLCIFNAIVTTCKTFINVIDTLSDVVISTPIAMYNWFNKPRIRHSKKHCNTSNGSGKFSHKLRASKKSCYNKRNCEYGRHGCPHTFMKHK